MKDKTILINIKEEGNDINEHDTKIKQYRQTQNENEAIPAKMKLKRNNTKSER
jgi:hypothetical protein